MKWIFTTFLSLNNKYGKKEHCLKVSPILVFRVLFNQQSTVEGSHKLIIANVQVSDSDCYKCEAVNEVGTVATSAHVKVHGKQLQDISCLLLCFHDPRWCPKMFLRMRLLTRKLRKCYHYCNCNFSYVLFLGSSFVSLSLIFLIKHSHTKLV